MDWLKFAHWANENWKGNFTEEEMETMAAEYSNATSNNSEIKSLMESLREDGNEDALMWLNEIEKSMEWYRCQLPKETAGRFREYLRDNHITYETSEVEDHIHFEVYCGVDEVNKANEFIDERC